MFTPAVQLEVVWETNAPECSCINPLERLGVATEFHSEVVGGHVEDGVVLEVELEYGATIVQGLRFQHVVATAPGLNKTAKTAAIDTAETTRAVPRPRDLRLLARTVQFSSSWRIFGTDDAGSLCMTSPLRGDFLLGYFNPCRALCLDLSQIWYAHIRANAYENEESHNADSCPYCRLA
jgi:hypothetical protein